MPQSPVTPTRRRRSSGFSINTGRPSHSRKSSFQSIQSPLTPYAQSGLDRSGEFGLAGGAVSEEAATNGLENLAAELAEEDWEEEYEDGLAEYDEAQSAGLDECQGDEKLQQNGTGRGPLGEATNGASHSSSRKSKHRKSRSGASDLSDYTDVDESEIISPKLRAHMEEIETLAQQDLTGGKSADSFSRVEAELKDLGSQASVESHTTRLTNAVNSISAHMTSQTRILATLFQPYTSPFSQSLDLDALDELLPLIAALITSLPTPPLTPLPSIYALRMNTADLLTSLAFLSDSLHMERQTVSQAARTLRAAKEIVEKLQMEITTAEEGRRWLELGAWEEKLKRREATIICGEVVDGFEKVCEGWRRRLVDGLAAG